MEQVGIPAVLVQNLKPNNPLYGENEIMNNVSIEDLIVAIIIYSIAVPVLAALAILTGFVCCFTAGPVPVYKFFKASFFTNTEKQILC